MEIFDIVDENDHIIGQATREDCHTDPSLIHRVVHFTLIDKGRLRVLLSQRSFSKANDAGKICFFGEHIVSGETYFEGVVRGVKEELRIKINVEQIVEVGHVISRPDHQTEFVRFFLIAAEEQEFNFDKGEMEKVFWVDVEDLKNRRDVASEMTRYWIDNLNWLVSFKETE